MLRAKLRLTRTNQVTEVLQRGVPTWIVAAVLIITGPGCQKNSGEAVVLTKEHIDAAVPDTKTPNSEPEPSSDTVRGPMADGQITVEGYAMKPEVRGTGLDPRALKHEQWLVTVRMLDNGRTFQIPADRAKWEKLRENDHVKIRYSTGKYTDTIWAAEIE